MTKLIEAIKSGNLDKVKHEYLRDNSSLNTEHKFYQTRPIDFAAQNGHLAILDYLITQGASLNTNPKKPSILYWFMKAVRSKSKTEILEWIQGNQAALFVSDPTLTYDHLKAFLGEDADWNSRQAHGGLFPIHYGILRENPYSKKRLIDWAGQSFPQNGWFTSYSFPLLLAENNCYDLLREMADNHICIDLNAQWQVDNPQFGVSIAWILAYNYQWDLLKELAFMNPVIALNAGPKHKQHPCYGVNLALLLANDKRWDLFNESKISVVDLNAGPKNNQHPENGVTVAYVLAKHHRWDHLKESKGHVIDLDAGPKNDQHLDKGITVAFLMASCHQCELLEELTINCSQVDLNAGPKNIALAISTTVALLLAAQKQWNLLEKLMTKSPPLRVEVAFKWTDPEGSSTQKSFLDILVGAEQWRLLERIIESNLQVSGTDENAYLTALNTHCNNPTFNQLVFYYQVKEKEREINQLIINFHSVYEAGERLPEKNRSPSDALSDFETSLDAYSRLLAKFSPEGVYYKKVMDSKMHLLMQFDVSNIHEAFLDTVLKVFPSPQTFSEIEGKREQVRYLTIDAAFHAGNHAYTMQAYASQLKENGTLRKEKRTLEKEKRTLEKILEALQQKTSKDEAPSHAKISNSLPTHIPSPRLELKGSKRDFNSTFFSTADLSDGESVKNLKQENLDEVENRADIDSESQRLPSTFL